MYVCTYICIYLTKCLAVIKWTTHICSNFDLVMNISTHVFLLISANYTAAGILKNICENAYIHTKLLLSIYVGILDCTDTYIHLYGVFPAGNAKGIQTHLEVKVGFLFLLKKIVFLIYFSINNEC